MHFSMHVFVSATSLFVMCFWSHVSISNVFYKMRTRARTSCLSLSIFSLSLSPSLSLSACQSYFLFVCMHSFTHALGRVVSNVIELVAQPHFHVHELGNEIC